MLDRKLAMLFAVVLLLFGVSSAQRGNASICDYYAITNYGTNSSATQYQLIQSILGLAFAGAGTLPNVSSNITGIFNPGFFDGTPVDLRPWFNASKDSTNLNDQAVAINWLDGGGTTPIDAFLTGAAPNITFANTTNEYRLFSHWFGAFQHIYGCSLPTPQPASPGGVLDLAYVHKFMDLNHTEIGHFIDQLTQASVHFGFSDDDATSLSQQMNGQYNVRCAPPVGTQLYSLCQDESCPLAFPSADCNAYSNLGPSGVPTSSGTAPVSTFAPVSTATTSAPSVSTTSAPPQTSSASPSSSSGISPGGIAGAAIGGAAVVFLFIAAMLFIFRRRRNHDPYIPNPSNPSYTAPSYTDPHTSYMSNQAEHWNGPPIAEMESPRVAGSPEMGQLTPQHLSTLSPGQVSPGGRVS